jgi:hypothetical protein
MEIVLNSKFFSGLSVERLGEKANGLGYDGIDLNVRPGHPVDPDNVTHALSKAIEVWTANAGETSDRRHGHVLDKPRAGKHRRTRTTCRSAGAICGELDAPRSKAPARTIRGSHVQ